MPKAAGAEMKTVRGPARPQPQQRAIKKFDGQVPSGGVAKHADKIKASEKPASGSIESRQQLY